MKTMTRSRIKAHSRAEIRDAILLNRTFTKAFNERDDHYYRVDRQHSTYLRGLPKWNKLIREYLDALNKEGVRTAYADICGKANGSCLGAKRTYSFTLQPPKFREPGKDEVWMVGDILCASDFYSFLNLIRINNDQLVFVTFEPIVGLQPYTPLRSVNPRHPRYPCLHPAVTFGRLARNLTRLLEIVRPGGYVYLDKPFQLGEFSGLYEFIRGVPPEEWDLSLWFKEFCKRNGCTLQVGNLLGPRYLIRKRNTRKPSAQK